MHVLTPYSIVKKVRDENVGWNGKCECLAIERHSVTTACDARDIVVTFYMSLDSDFRTDSESANGLSTALPDAEI